MKLTKEKCLVAFHCLKGLEDYPIKATTDEKQLVLEDIAFGELFKDELDIFNQLINEYFELTQENKRLQRFKDYFDDLHNTGLEVANWHLNGSLEPFDNFYDSAMEWSERDETN